MTLTEFLLARITEDEAAARAGISGQADPENGWGLVEYQGMAGLTLAPHVGHVHERVQGEHIIRWHPYRVLAECAAKRRIMESHPLTSDVVPVHTGPTPAVGCETCHTVTASSIDDVDYVEALGPCDTLLALALPYADHPDFHEEWRA